MALLGRRAPTACIGTGVTGSLANGDLLTLLVRGIVHDTVCDCATSAVVTGRLFAQGIDSVIGINRLGLLRTEDITCVHRII